MNRDLVSRCSPLPDVMDVTRCRVTHNFASLAESREEGFTQSISICYLEGAISYSTCLTPKAALKYSYIRV